MLSSLRDNGGVAATSELCVPLGNKDTALLNIFKITVIRLTVLSTVRKWEHEPQSSVVNNDRLRTDQSNKNINITVNKRELWGWNKRSAEYHCPDTLTVAQVIKVWNQRWHEKDQHTTRNRRRRVENKDRVICQPHMTNTSSASMGYCQEIILWVPTCSNDRRDF